MGAISEIKCAVDLVQELTKYVRKSANYDPQILQDLEALRGKVLDAYTTEIELRKIIYDLQKELSLKQLPWDSDFGAYYQETEEGRRDYFCQKCVDTDARLCRLHNLGHRYLCRACNLFYQNSAQQQATQASAQSYNTRRDKEW